MSYLGFIDNHFDLYARLPGRAKDQVMQNLQLFQKVDSLAREKSLHQACIAVARRYGIHHMRLRRLWEGVKKQGWVAAVDKRHASFLWSSSEEVALPPEFIDYWKFLVEQNQRKCKPAYRALLRQLSEWRTGAGDPIPGYSSPPVNSMLNDFPNGWSYRNLMRHIPERHELAASRQGKQAARAHLPSVHTTRVGLYPLAHVQFDDRWCDFEVIVGQRGTARLLEFGAVDFFTGLMFPPALKPRIRNMETGKMQVLNERDFRLYIAWFLTDIGWDARGTILNMEHGTAALRGNVVEQLQFLTGGAVSIVKGGIDTTPILPGQHQSRAKGNPRAKALKEGLGNLLHNEAADMIAMPGQVGKDRDSQPESHHGRTKENETLLAIANLYPAIANELRMGFLRLEQAVDLMHRIYDRLNQRTDHKIEGWEKAGLMLPEFRMTAGQPWQSLAIVDQWPDTQRQMIQGLIQSDPTLRRLRRMSPAEAWEHRLSKEHNRKLPLSALPAILGQDLGKIRTVREKSFIFQDSELGPGNHYYLAECMSHAGPELLKNGSEWLTFVHPFRPEILIVCKPDGAYHGICRRQNIPTANDFSAIRKEHGKMQSLYNQALADTARRADTYGTRREDQAHNARVIARAAQAGEPSTPKRRKYTAPATDEEETFSLEDFESVAQDNPQQTNGHPDDFDVTDFAGMADD